MDQQIQYQVEQKLAKSWKQLYPRILDRFTTVSRADVDSALDTADLVSVIADKTHLSERLVENRLVELVGVGGPTGSSMIEATAGGQPFAERQGSGAGQSERIPFGQRGQS